MDSSDFSNLVIVDQELHLFYRLHEFSFQDGPGTVLADLFADAANGVDVMPADQRSALSGRYKDTPVWEPLHDTGISRQSMQKIAISTDLHPAISEMLSGESPDLVRRWTMSPQAKRLLERADLYEQGVIPADRVTKELYLKFGAAAQARMRADKVDYKTLQIVVLELQIIAFSTGAAFLVAQIKFEKPDGYDLQAVEMVEAVHAVSRFNKCHWVGHSGVEPVIGKEFSLGLLLRRFAESRNSTSVQSDRVSSYSFVQLKDATSEPVTDKLAAFLARRYTSDYAFEPATARLASITEFSNVRHAASDEGVGTVICPTSDGAFPSFLQNWKADRLRGAYSPIVVMLLHENWFLTQQRVDAVFPGSDDEVISKLEGILDEALQFRLCFRFSSVSDISMHNSLSLAMRSTLELDRKLSEMQGDVEAVSARLNAIRSAEQAKRFQWLGLFSGAALAGLTAFTIFKELLELLMVPHRVAPLADGSPTDPDQLTARWHAVFLALVIGVFSWHFGKSRVEAAGKRENSVGKTKMAMRHQMVRRSIK